LFAQSSELSSWLSSTGTRFASPTAAALATETGIVPDIMIARSSTDYRVTQGDVYTLDYTAGSSRVSYTITVDSSYRIRVSNLGIVNGSGKTFMQLKSEVETIVTNNYPLGGVQLVLSQPALFKVFITGEVYVAAEVSVWALTRLSSLIGRNLTSYASIRDVSVRSSSGQTRAYDLFKAQRSVDLSQDPYLRPGDTIVFNRTDRVVTVYGEVERPGSYQMLKGENLKELIEVYANGFTNLADTNRMEMVRLVNTDANTGGKIFLTEQDLAYNYSLENFDEIYIPTIIRLRPVMFVEGAVVSTILEAEDNETRSLSSSISSSTSSTGRLLVQFTKGETYASLVRRNIGWFTMVSDTQNAYIIRNGERILIDLNPILYDTSYHDNFAVQENDVLVIPFRQYFVSVSGAVRSPGRYPYIPDRDWEYYIGLAGGFIEERNSGKSVTITDMNGKQMKKTDVISPETLINANANSGLYYFNMYAPIITTVLGLISTSLSLWAVISR
jgi:protein involved in polysaccharide export with SLBB domain